MKRAAGLALAAVAAAAAIVVASQHAELPVELPTVEGGCNGGLLSTDEPTRAAQTVPVLTPEVRP